MLHPVHEMYKVFDPKDFTKMLIDQAPFFGSIDPIVTKLEQRTATVSIKNQRMIQNHFGSIHAIALCNAAELAAGITAIISAPLGAKSIPIGMNVDYLAKAKTDIEIIAEAHNVDFSVEGDIVIPVVAYDEQRNKVLAGTIKMNLKLP